MEYLSLFKANYINGIDEKKLYDSRLNSMNTVHFSIKINDNDYSLVIAPVVADLCTTPVALSAPPNSYQNNSQS